MSRGEMSQGALGRWAGSGMPGGDHQPEAAGSSVDEAAGLAIGLQEGRARTVHLPTLFRARLSRDPSPVQTLPNRLGEELGEPGADLLSCFGKPYSLAAS